MIITATLCYVRNDDSTLMLYRNKKPNDVHQGKWNGLGGKVIPGESPEECVIREVLEESGLRLTQVTMKGVLTFPEFDSINDWVVFVFRGDNFEGELTASPEGDLEWIKNERLLDLALWEGDRYFLKWLDNPGFFSGKFVYRNGQLTDHCVSLY